MKRVTKYLMGLVTCEVYVFFDSKLNHIEYDETWFLFKRMTIKHEVRTVYLPDVKTLESIELRVIADAFLELTKLKELIVNDDI